MANTDYLKKTLGNKFKEGMSLEDISEALAALNDTKIEEEKEKESSEIKKYKELLSKANSEAAGYKKELRAKQTEQEAREAEQKEAYEAMQTKLKELEEEKKLSDATAQFVSLGFSSDLAKDTASAYLGGDLNKLIENQKAFLENQEALLKSKMMKKTPRPENGNGEPQPMTKEKLFSMSLEDRMHFAREHQEEYKALFEKH